MGPRRPRGTSGAKAIRAGTRASGANRGGPPKRGPAPRAAAASRSGLEELQRLHARRLRACRSLGIPVPSEAESGPPESLLQRIAHLDRRIEVSLDLAGGRHFPPWNAPEEPLPGSESDDTDPADPDPAFPEPAFPEPGLPEPGFPEPGFPEPGDPDPAHRDPASRERRDDGGEGQPAETSSGDRSSPGSSRTSPCASAASARSGASPSGSTGRRSGRGSCS
jgi:hypothetical protein